MDASFDYVRRIVPETSTSFVVVPSFPLSGATIDMLFTGGQYFDTGSLVSVTTLLSISRASIGYARTSTGTLTLFTNDTLRITDLGLLTEDARTNVVLWSQDLTNAAWVKTTMTAALDQTGPDSVVNSASSILATAGNATVLQSITLGSSARYQSAYVKRLIGSGIINMTMDNGVTWTAITVTNNWTLAEIPTQTIANPVVGFRIVTNGDQIAVDFVQNENGAFSSTPIPTTTTAVTRAGDLIIGIGDFLAVFNVALPNSILVDVTQINPASNQAIVGQVGTATLLGAAGGTSTGTQIHCDGPDVVATLGGGDTLIVAAKCAMGQSATGRSIVGGGGTVATDANSGFLLTPVLSQNSGITSFVTFRRLVAWKSKLADATLQAFTA